MYKDENGHDVLDQGAYDIMIGPNSSGQALKKVVVNL